eukprot:TRINITY_DN846_c0_g1_i1.p2 TRINITY_DN846_c0_g1~~TRINITY_DN846_c0_g1_i1.p2  ORF type:complete len:183 (-),score=42.10 TRINITY_DN846_c0_g1_i1:357-905(-)
MGCGSTKAVAAAAPSQLVPATTPPTAGNQPPGQQPPQPQQPQPQQQAASQSGAASGTANQPQTGGGGGGISSHHPPAAIQTNAQGGPKYLSLLQELIHSEKNAKSTSGIDMLVEVMTPAAHPPQQPTTTKGAAAPHHHPNGSVGGEAALPKSIDVLAEMAAENPDKPYHGIRLLNDVQKSAA